MHINYNRQWNRYLWSKWRPSSFDELIIFCLLFDFSPLNNVKNPSPSFIKIGSPYSSFPSFDSEPFLTFKSSLINLSLIQTNDEMFSSELNERRTYTNLLIPTEGHTGESCRFKSSPTSCKNLSEIKSIYEANNFKTF